MVTYQLLLTLIKIFFIHVGSIRLVLYTILVKSLRLLKQKTQSGLLEVIFMCGHMFVQA